MYNRERSEEHLSEICCIKEKLLEWIKMEMNCGLGGENGACLKSLGELTDMVKDLAEAESHCKKAIKEEAETEYYESIVEAMHAEGGNDRPGYDHYRYASTGRYAPKGHGTRYGYSTKGNPRGMNSNNADYSGMEPNVRMGYPQDKVPMNYNDPYDPMYGHEGIGGPWYYHEGEKREEHMTPEEKAHHAMETMKEAWHDVKPELRKEMKGDITKLVNDIPV